MVITAAVVMATDITAHIQAITPPVTTVMGTVEAITGTPITIVADTEADRVTTQVPPLPTSRM